MQDSKKMVGLALGTVAAAGAIVGTALLLARRRKTYVIVDAGPEVLEHLPAEAILSHHELPTGYTLAAEVCVVSDGGLTGVLIQSQMSGMYQVFDGCTIAGIDQDFAADVAEEYPVYDDDDDDWDDDEYWDDEDEDEDECDGCCCPYCGCSAFGTADACSASSADPSNGVTTASNSTATCAKDDTSTATCAKDDTSAASAGDGKK